MNKILLNKVVALSVLVSVVSFNACAMFEPEATEDASSEAQKVNAPLVSQPTINGSVCSGIYNPELNAIMNAMQTSGYTPAAVDSSRLTESQRNAAVYFMNPRGN